MQDKYKINDIEIFQPDSDLQASFETTYTSDSTRVQSGVLHATPMYTVEQFSYTATDVPVKEVKTILQQVIKGKSFKLHYFSPYYGVWRDGNFRVGKEQLQIGTLKEDGEKISSLSFNMTGDEPL